MKENWEYKKLGEVCEILDNKRKPITKSNRIKGSIPYYGASGIQDYVKDFIFDGRFLLIGEDGAKWGKNENSAYIIEGKSWVNNHVHVLKTKNNLIDVFAQYYLNKTDLSSYITGAIVPKLTQSSLINIQIPVPPIEEQERIVAELDLLSGIIDKQKQQLKELDTLSQSIFYSMFGDPITNEKGWPINKLGSLCKSELGKTINKNKDLGEFHPYLCALNIKWNNIDTSYLKQTRFEENELERYLVEKGDLLVCEGGDIGRSAIWNKDEKILYQNALHRLRFNGEITALYCLYVLWNFKMQDVLDSRYGKGVTIKHLVQSSLYLIPIPVPPLDLQNQFAEKIEKIEKQKEAINKSIEETQKLFDYTMDKYFG